MKPKSNLGCDVRAVEHRAQTQWLAEEMAVMRELPERRMESAKRERVKVDSGTSDDDLDTKFEQLA
jgi:hypothetical protein